MFSENEIQTIFNGDVTKYKRNDKDINFSIGNDDFELQSGGLLTRLRNNDNDKKECHIQITSIDMLLYCIEHMDEWEDDWN